MSALRSEDGGRGMTERVLIFLIVASTIVAVTLILGVVSALKSSSDARKAEAKAYVIECLRQIRGEADAEQTE